MLPNGDIVVGGAFGLARYLPNGQLDTTFGSGGLATTTIPNSAVQGADAVFVQPDGKILLGGGAFLNLYHAPQAAAMARFNADGSVDHTFGSGRSVTAASFASIGTLGLDAAGDIFTLPVQAFGSDGTVLTALQGGEAAISQLRESGTVSAGRGGAGTRYARWCRATRGACEPAPAHPFGFHRPEGFRLPGNNISL